MGTNQLLRTVIDTRDATESRTSQLKDVQRAMGLLERDLSQITNRPIRNEYGDQIPALHLGFGEYAVEFTRLGWRNPTALPRSNVQRVAYRLNEGELERHYWLVLDRAEDSEPRVQKILADVEDFRVQAMNENGDATDTWAGDSGMGSELSGDLDLGESPGESGKALPVALEVFVQIEQLGEIRKVINLVSEADLSRTDGQGDNQDQDQDQDGSTELDDKDQEELESEGQNTRDRRNRRDEELDDV